jgi:hypothetical protein
MGPGEMEKPAVPAKAARLNTSLKALRTRVDRAETPKLIDALKVFLTSQRREIASRLRANAHHNRPLAKDTAVWFPAKRFDRELSGILARPLTAMAQNVTDHIDKVLPRKATKAQVSAVDRALSRGAARVTGINETTRDKIRDVIARGIDQGMTVLQVADLIEAGDFVGGLYSGSVFDSARAEMIARTELMDAYNGAALGAYGDAGVEMVEAIDGDGDEECADRDGQVFDIAEADSIEDHPNGTLDWVPIIPEEATAEAAPTAEAVSEEPPSGGISAGEVTLQGTSNVEDTASSLVQAATQAEPDVTADIRAIGEITKLEPNAAFTLDGRTFHTLDARLKTEASTSRKVAGELSANPDKTLEQVEADMKDNLRYTYIADQETYNASVRQAMDELVARGYEPLRVKNFWGYDNGYAGINSNWRTPSGQVFEVQFHTQSGLETKEVLSHPLYEAQRLLPEGSAGWNDYQRQIDQLWSTFRSANPSLGRNMGWLREMFP